MTDDEATWAALIHRPASPGTGNAFEDPRFGLHVAFLRQLLAEGLLVAAGPFSDVRGEGMSVVRFPGADRLEEITRRAKEEDESVSGGLFTVQVRPWNVMFGREV